MVQGLGWLLRARQRGARTSRGILVAPVRPVKWHVEGTRVDPYHPLLGSSTISLETNRQDRSQGIENFEKGVFFLPFIFLGPFSWENGSGSSSSQC